MNLVIGTAGHIDHGKTALVKVLTGTDADRLPEERARGITIDLGFAELELDDLHLGFVDVPGHERFVRNMLAGASGIDMVMLVIAADQGVMPQTREHFDICRLLDIRCGIMVLTKSDLADEEMLEHVRAEAAELVAGSFLDGAQMITVSSRSGEGIDLLRTALAESARKVPRRRIDLIARMPIDRSFTVKGFGAVATGTLVSGMISEGSELELLPLLQAVRVRGLQSHQRATTTARAGQRLAANLGIDHHKVERGMVLAEKGVLQLTQMLDVKIEVLSGAKQPLQTRQRVRVNIGSAELLGRVQVLDNSDVVEQGKHGFVQLRLEKPIAAIYGERFVIRGYSPQSTLGGGFILDPLPGRHRRKDVAETFAHLNALASATTDNMMLVEFFIKRAGTKGMSFLDVQARTGITAAILKTVVDNLAAEGRLVDAVGIYLSHSSFAELEKSVTETLENFHKRDALSEGMPRQVLRERIFRLSQPETFRVLLQKLEQNGAVVSDRDLVRLASHTVEFSEQDESFRSEILKIYGQAALAVPKFDEVFSDACKVSAVSAERGAKLFRSLVRSGKIVKVSDEFFFAADEIAKLVQKLRTFAASTADRLIDVAGFKQLAGISRKYAIPLLEYYDREKVTQRIGEKRLIVK